DYRKIEQETNGGHALISLPVGPTLDGTPKWGSLGLGYYGYGGETDDFADTDTRGYHLYLAWGKDLNDQWTLGYSAAYVHDNAKSNLTDVRREMNDGVRQAVGAQYKASDALMVGL